jgi:ribosomal protein S27E
MNSHRIFCSACDRDVQVLFTDESMAADGQATIPDSEVVCLEIGASCTGAMCPIAAQPPAVMMARLARFDPENPKHRRVRARCSGCQNDEELIIVDAQLAVCPVCKGATFFSAGVPTA